MKVTPTEAFCMNLDTRTDRWNQVMQDFKILQDVLPITLTRVSAICNKSKPTVGTFETVFKIINMAKENNMEYVLILEDDLYIIDPNKIKICLENVPDDWHFLSGGVYHYIPDTMHNEHWMKMKDFCSMHFVIIRNTIYDKILALDKTGHIDRTIGKMAREKKINMYLMHEMSCQQRPGFSNLRNNNVNDNANNKKNLPWIQNDRTLK